MRSGRRRKMEVKEAIGFINDLEIYIHEDYPEFREYKEHFIALLQRGEALESILNELKNDTKRTKTFRKHLTYYEALVAVEQKYLKEAKQAEADKDQDNRK